MELRFLFLFKKPSQMTRLVFYYFLPECCELKLATEGQARSEVEETI